jgi:hypothetical protein
LGNLLAKMGGEAPPRFDRRDQSQVTTTFESHPESQCRLDTYRAGAMCPKTFPVGTIPGVDSAYGHSSLEAERAAARFACIAGRDPLGTIRPACWYASRLGGS